MSSDDKQHSATPRTDDRKPAPMWVTSWPDWYGIHGNVTVVPLEDYQQLERELAQAKESASVYAALAAHHVDTISALQGQETATPDYKSLYTELIMAVVHRWSGETRHQTALRYIQQADAGAREPPRSAGNESGAH